MELKLSYQKEYDKQVSLIEELQEKGFNIITCPDCGSVIITRRKQIMIKCMIVEKRILKSLVLIYFIKKQED